MRNLRLTVIALVFVFVSWSNTSKAQAYQQLSYQDFYDDLSPYGEWLNDPQYGYVWLPDVGSDFRPYYTNGYWAYTQYGNTWVSNYDWGWAAFHYGRWTYDNYYGWIWIPGNEWAPAWVSWRSANDYYGWAPMGPGININVNLGLIPMDWWVFINPGYMYDRSFYRYCNNDYGFRRNVYNRTQIINYTYIDNRTVYYSGPRSDDYYRRTGVRPSMYNVMNSGRRGNPRMAAGNRLNIYRPEIARTANAAPSQVVNIDRGISRRPQSFSGSMDKAAGRQQVLQQVSNQRINNNPGRMGSGMSGAPGNTIRQQNGNSFPAGRPRNIDNPAMQQQQMQGNNPQRMQPDQQRNFQQQQPGDQQRMIRQQQQQQMQQQQMDQQRVMQQQQMQQQRMQQQADQQRAMQQQMDQQRAMQQQQMQQQRMQQQADQQRAMQQQQMDQQRAMQQQQMQQQRMQQQADQQRAMQQQMDQQRNMQQQQMQQQRMQQQADQQRAMQQQMQQQRAQQQQQMFEQRQRPQPAPQNDNGGQPARGFRR